MAGDDQRPTSGILRASAGAVLVGFALATEPAFYLRLAHVADAARATCRHPSWVKLPWLFAGLLLVALAGAVRPPSARPIRLNRIDAAFLFLAALDCALCLVAPHPAASLPQIPFYLALASVYAVLRLAFLHAPSRGTAWWAAAVAAGTVASLALYHLAPDYWAKQVHIGLDTWVIQVHDLAGTFANPNYTASFLLLGLPALFALSPRRTWVPLGLLCLLGLALTASRAAWLSLTATAAIAALSSRITLSRRTLAIATGAACLLGLALLALPHPRKLGNLADTRTVRLRLHLWKVALEGFAERPFLGQGPGAYGHLFARLRPADHRKLGLSPVSDSAHNVILHRLAETGLVGTAAFLLLVVALVGPLLSRPPPETAALGWGLVAFLAHNLLSPTLQTPATAAAFAAVCALYAAGCPDRTVATCQRPQVLRFPLAACALMLAFNAWSWATLCLADHHLRRADDLRLHGRLREAQESLEKGLALAPRNLALRHDLAGTLAYLGHPHDALAHYGLVEIGRPHHDQVRANRCLLTLGTGDWKAVEALALQALARDETHLGLHTALAQARFRLGDKAGALAALDRALAQAPDDERLLRMRQEVAASAR